MDEKEFHEYSKRIHEAMLSGDLDQMVQVAAEVEGDVLASLEPERRERIEEALASIINTVEEFKHNTMPLMKLCTHVMLDAAILQSELFNLLPSEVLMMMAQQA